VPACANGKFTEEAQRTQGIGNFFPKPVFTLLVAIMKQINRHVFLTLCAGGLALLLNVTAQAAADGDDQGLKHLEFTVDGATREALLYAPMKAKTASTPLVFVFHGHGGSSQQVSRGFGIHRLWPQAIVIYPQGLNTAGKLVDPEGKKTGWQNTAGILQDRDLKFFDTMLAQLKQDYKVDEKRIYCTGHSNGGGFTYLLWAERGEVFAAVAPSSAAYRGLLKTPLKPKPCLHIGGEKDPLVKFEWQKQTMDSVRKINGCDEEGKEWAKYCTLYPSKTGTPFIAAIHPGGHIFPTQAPPLIVRFFKEHPPAGK